MVRMILKTALAVALSVSTTGVSAMPFSSFTIFGDSLSDNGNAFLATGVTTIPETLVPPFIPSAPYPRMPFPPLLPALTNGPNWAEVLGTSIGLPVAPSLFGGKNFAFAGAETGPLPPTPVPSPSPSLAAQFFGPPPMFDGGPIDPSGLYAVWGGANDVRAALDVFGAAFLSAFAMSGDPIAAKAAGIAAAAPIISAGVVNLATILGAIATGGGKHILSINVPDIGLTPALDFFPLGSDAVATELSAAFNSGLAIAIGGIEAAFMVDVIEVDIFTLIKGVVAAPAAFGLTNAMDACVADLTTCVPDDYMFWDGIHPTAAGHRLIAAAVHAAVIPAPATGALLALGLLLMTAGRWYRNR